ncbi:MAG: hypothetical protein CFE45_09840, partial [Burkholderiales bacterium PBB5]
MDEHNAPAPVQSAPAPVPPAADHSQAGPAASGQRRTQRWPHALGLLVFVLAVLVAPALGGWALFTRPAALPLALGLVPGLRTEGVQGTLASGTLRIQHLDWTLPAQAGRLQIDQLALDGLTLGRAARAGTWATLRWQQLSAARVQYTSGPPSGKPATLPADLGLPLALERGAVQIGTLQIDQLPPVQQLQAWLSLGTDQGRLHRVDALRFTLEGAQFSGQAQVATAAPLTTQAQLSAVALGQPAWQAQASAGGPLRRLAVQADLQGQAAKGQLAAPSLQAQATVEPLATWPLAALALSTRALDLAALSPRLPHTALDIAATVQSQGLDQPVQVQATVDNRLPGTLDAGRLPLRRLALAVQGEVAHPDRLTLHRFDLQLADSQGDAGRATGQGQWAGERLDLALTLAGLQPARLHSRAAALDIAGPLT